MRKPTALMMVAEQIIIPERWSHGQKSGYMLKVESPGFTAVLHTECEIKERIQNNFRVFDLGQKNGLAIHLAE